MKELLIVGSGPIGLYAAFVAGMRKIDALVLESAQTIGGQLNLYLEKSIYDIPGFSDISAQGLIDNLYNQYKEYENEIPIKLNENLLSIEQKDNYFVVTTNKEVYEVKKILLTHGGGMFLPRTIPGLDATNVKYNVDHLADYKDKNVAIFGGGDSALDWANMIKDIAKEVYVIHRRNEFRAHLSSIDTFKKKGGIIYTPHNLKDQVIENGLVTKVTLENLETKDTVELDVDAVLAFFGLVQSKASYEDWLVTIDNGAIVVDRKMQSSVDGIYACGNGAYYEGKQKMITAGFGEVVTAIGAINYDLHPEQKVPKYSSMLK